MKKLLKYSSKPTFVSGTIFNGNLVALHKIKESITLKTPVFVRVIFWLSELGWGTLCT